MTKVFLAGEGPNDIGQWCRMGQYVDEASDAGVVGALLEQVRDEGWEVAGGVAWRKIKKLKVGKPGGAEVQNVRGAALMAKEAGCDVLVFVRDRDGTRANPNTKREGDIEAGIRQAESDHQPHLRVIGGVAVKKLESWLLAIAGVVKSETKGTPERILLHEYGIPDKNTQAMVELVRKQGLSDLPEDACSLRRWLTRARDILGPE